MKRTITAVLGVFLVAAMLAGTVSARPGDPLPDTVVHIVQQGETLFSISRRYGLTVSAIAHANGIPDPRRIYVGQRLVIPNGEPVLADDETISYVVSPGDTLASVALRYNTTWQTLAEINGLLSPNVSYVGQVVQVPSPGVFGEEGPGLTRGGARYVVRPNDTLFGIAMRYSVSAWALAAASHVANPALIYAGQELVIPGDGSGLLPEPFSYVDVQPLPAVQGETVIVGVHTVEPVVLEGHLLERDIRFAEEGGVYYGLVGVHVFAEPGLYELELTAIDGQGRSTTIATGVVVEAGAYGYERISVPGSRTGLLDPAAVAAERERLGFAIRTFSTERRWTGPFQRPGAGTISSYFGTHRAYDGGPYTAYHSGADLRAPTGTPVSASAAGTVILAEPTAIHGNLVVIDHGWGVLSGYAHLSAMEVAAGQQVAAGDLIGKVGNTGLSTGSHLHWEVWVAGISVSGLQWLEEFYPWPEREDVAPGG